MSPRVMNLFLGILVISLGLGVKAQDGYATSNGGTTGGAGGVTTTVSSAAAFQTAIKVCSLFGLDW